MIRYFDDHELLAALKRGVERSNDIIDKVTEYHGGPLTTEYILTSDIARELIEQGFLVNVECLNRRAVNALVSKKASGYRSMGSKRTDLVIWGTELIPAALIEVKIGVKTLRKIRPDLRKITRTISMLKPEFARRVVGSSIFQVHVQGSARKWKRAHLQSAIEKIENNLDSALTQHAKGQRGFSFSMYPLQSEHAGIVEREVEDYGQGQEQGQHGHATRFYAVLIRSTVALNTSAVSK